jgi:hypothetical protein
MNKPALTAFSIVVAALSLTSVGATNPPCPVGSVGDRPFDYARDAKNCVIGSVEGAPTQSRDYRTYNVYCPGRMTDEHYKKVWKDLVDGTLTLTVGGNPIRADYQKWGLVPHMGHGSHRFHYSCVRDGKSCVSTHIKVITHNVANSTALRPEHMASYCKLVNQSGAISVGRNMDRQFRCDIHFRSTESNLGQETAKVLLRSDQSLLDDLRKQGLKACLLSTTDIQCAPCRTSDKLVARTFIATKSYRCPAGTLDTLE